MANKKPLKLETGKLKEFAIGDTVTPMFIPLKQIEIDFGTSAFTQSGIFNISDSTVTSGSTIMTSKALKPPSDARSIDELYVESFDISTYAKAGSFDLYIKSLNGSVSGKFIINYLNN